MNKEIKNSQDIIRNEILKQRENIKKSARKAERSAIDIINELTERAVDFTSDKLRQAEDKLLD
jgi:hypothetical protein